MRVRLTVVLPLLLIASGAIWWTAPPGAAQFALACSPRSPQPAHPLEMNTVVSDPRTSQFRDPLIKHMIMEKFLFDCVRDGGTPNERRFVREVETFIEIIQRVQAGRTVPVEKRVEEIACEKDVTPGGRFGISCSARDIPLQQSVPEFRCDPDPGPADPTEMNTVITSRQDIIKTFKVDKESFCGPSFAQEHVYLFTEIVEQRAGGAADTIRVTEKKFQAIACAILTQTAAVVACRHFIPGQIPPS